MKLDAIEAWANAVVGLAVSVAAVHVLRATGGWETLSAFWVSALFFGLSVARSWALRRVFRRVERRS